MENQFTYDTTMFRETFEHSFTYLNGFMRNVSRFRKKCALFDPAKGNSWTYEELNADCNRLANALQADGVTKNDVVLYQLMNSAEFVFCYIGSQKIGAIASPANYKI